MLEIGNLYRVKKNHWFLYSSTDYADEVDIAFIEHKVKAAALAKSYDLGCLMPGDYFVLLEEDELYRRVLAKDGTIGWILVSEISTRQEWDSECFEDVSRL